MLEVREKTRGQRPGDAYVRIVRPFEEEFEHGDEGQLIASEKAIEAAGPVGRWFRGVRSFLFGRPISSEHEEHERLTKVKALAIFSSDNISSSAYGPEEIMRVLALAGLAVMSAWTVTLTVLIIIMLAIVTVSYRQTIKAYPKGASSYLVAGDNLGDVMGILAASALLIGYVVTVAVSISAGVAAHDLDRARPVRLPGADRRRGHRAADRRQPARHPRVRHDLHGADVPVYRRHPRRRRLGPGPIGHRQLGSVHAAAGVGL